MARRSTRELAFSALAIEGGLLAPDFLNKVAHLEAAEQSEAAYDIPRGLKLRDEIGRYWKIAQNLWQDFDAKRKRSDVDTHAITVREFLEPFCRQVLGFADLRSVGQLVLDERVFPIGFSAGDGRVPLVFAAFDQGLDKPGKRFGDGLRSRSPFLLAQECLNASEQMLWGIVSNGLKLRILRENASLTRPAYIESDLEAIFAEGLYPDFTALWLLAHGTRFGKVGAELADSPLERWRNTAQEDGIRARDRLRVGVTEALRALGTGFVAHPENGRLRERIQAGQLSTQAYFEQLLRLVYRFIFLATIEDRELVFAPDATSEAKARYQAGYSLQRLRQLAARRRSYDRHADLWQTLTITVAGLSQGQGALGLPALGGLFEAAQCPDLDGAALENQALLSALFSLCFFREGAALSRVNYRDMDSEELGSVYESLLELVPVVTLGGGARIFGFVGDDEEGSTKGNARKLTGSYYTPDSLVQELIKSALEPVIAQTLKANPQEPVKALLGLSVCDPACGSGHFLLAAARRIAEEVAQLNAADGNPLPDDYRHALRDVVAHCIYGVDKNPMAVELARTALWLEAYTPDRPLTFLDHHLRCGDALLGILDSAILENGIPDKAFNALSGDDKEVVKAIKKANREALKAIEKARHKSHHMLSLGLEDEGDIVALEALPDDTLSALEAKRSAYRDAEARVASSRARLAADLFVAAFVLPKTKEHEPIVPTSQDLWLVMNGSDPRPGVGAVATDAARVAQAFHWWQAFPQVKAKGGFDVLLGNPPWERIKLQEEEYFATRSPLVAEAPHKAERGRRIGLLAEGMLLHTLYPEAEAAQGLVPPNRAEQQLYAEFLAARRGAEAVSLFAHDAGRYPLTGVGDVNTYALFAETFSQLMGQAGRAGFIVPTGIATDDSTKAYFSSLTQTGRLASLYDFENRDAIFPAVHRSYKFCLLTLGRTNAAEFVCFAAQVSQLADSRRLFRLTSEEFRLINPNTLTCPVFRSERDAELTKKIYRAAPVLIEEEPTERNPWGIRFMRMLDMANDSDLFHDASAPDRLPLYEAKMIHQFDHRWATYSDDGASRDVLTAEKSQPDYFVTPRYWVEGVEVEQRLEDKGWSRGWLMGWRDICRATDERTVIASVVPKVATGDTLLLMFPNSNHGPRVACLLADQCSLVHDYVARQKVGGTHLKYHVKKQLPNLPPSQYSDEDIAYIVPRVLELTYTSRDLGAWARDLGYEGEPLGWDPERRAMLRAELDAYYARLYGLTRDELRYILDPADVMGADYPSETFRVLKNSEMREFGEYRTRRLVLEAWDQIERRQ
ncbi:MAG: N-6 DNA methylase [Ralstonia sp.]|jgi:N-6 DNA Methylase|uniref:site-specific DNA-methyltransferase (adenine-specific) n=5 Tax=Bacteria TaxID=2 RepID=A0A2P4REN5_RALPI|nr:MULTISPECIES: N-6 DNA methylase [Ralstonia]MBA4232283.1 type II restriction endonuclease [Ralstonia sp.]MBA4236711.1 type II restriction endonuclease [Ralstonia sp.]MBA4403328.1 type II restriction endonuclease [Ralstonia sp.]MBA9847589.1 SAM-dependent DNA methyltransferase [Ralstonia pickettii]MBA9852946.1 SAM-dependent DNA methyltransferase [Ralstonia pickettii]